MDWPRQCATLDLRARRGLRDGVEPKAFYPHGREQRSTTQWKENNNFKSKSSRIMQFPLEAAREKQADGAIMFAVGPSQVWFPCTVFLCFVFGLMFLFFDVFVFALL